MEWNGMVGWISWEAKVDGVMAFGIVRVVAFWAPSSSRRYSRKIGVSSSEVVATEYAALNLKNTVDIQEAGGHVRIRQHVNPLTSSYMIPAQLPDWPQVFKDSTLPLMVDIGSGSGRFLIWHAKRAPDSTNFLGLEIRQKLVKRAELWVKELSLNNICFLFANATVSFERLVSSYPGPLVFVSILCPDPHFKTKHHKRRVVQTPLVNSILTKLAPGGQVFVQSDVLDVALDMRNQLDAFCCCDTTGDRGIGVLDHIDTVDPSLMTDDGGWLLRNPLGIRTEREIHAEDIQGAKVYRRLYQKRQV